VVNPRAAANHRLAVLAHVPGKSQRRIEVVLVSLRRAQIAAQHSAQNRWAIQVVIEQLVFVDVGGAVGEREVGLDAPGISHEEAQPIVARGVSGVVRLRLSGITDACRKRTQRKPQDIRLSRQKAWSYRDESTIAIG
jgi:hypothetical protein